MEDIVYFPLNISNRIDVSYDRDLKDLLAAICNDGKYETMIKV